MTAAAAHSHPETAVAKPAKEEPKPAAAEDTKAPVKEAPEPKPSGAPGSVIQLGAFANEAQAERAWTALSARFPSGYGIPLMSDESLTLTTRVLNHNLPDARLAVRHRA